MVTENIKRKKIVKDLSEIFENNLKETMSIDKLDNFNSLIILQIMNLAKLNYKKKIDGKTISQCSKISEIVDLLL